MVQALSNLGTSIQHLFQSKESKLLDKLVNELVGSGFGIASSVTNLPGHRDGCLQIYDGNKNIGTLDVGRCKRKAVATLVLDEPEYRGQIIRVLNEVDKKETLLIAPDNHNYQYFHLNT